jgi:16S rRNA G966 N2-methylase RsmD
MQLNIPPIETSKTQKKEKDKKKPEVPIIFPKNEVKQDGTVDVKQAPTVTKPSAVDTFIDQPVQQGVSKTREFSLPEATISQAPAEYGKGPLGYRLKEFAKKLFDINGANPDGTDVGSIMRRQEDAAASLAKTENSNYFNTRREFTRQNKATLKDIKEGVTDVSKSDIPFAGTALDAVEVGKILKIKSKLNNDKDISPEELQSLKAFVDKQDSLEKKRKYMGYRVGEGLRNSISFGLELAGTTAATFGTGSAENVAIKKTASEGFKKGIKSILEDKLVRDAILSEVKRSTGRLAVQVGAQEALHAPEETMQRMLGDIKLENNVGKLNVTVANDGQKLSQAAINAMSGIFVETASEFSGGPLGEIAGLVGKKVMSILPKEMVEQVAKLGVIKTLLATNKDLPVNAVTELINKMGWNGIIEEMGEEQVGNVMNGILHSMGLGDQKFHIPTKQELGEQILTFGLMGSAINGATRGYQALLKKQIKEELPKDITDLSDIVDNHVKETSSVLPKEEIVAQLVDQGIDANDAEEIVSNLTQEEMQNIGEPAGDQVINVATEPQVSINELSLDELDKEYERMMGGSSTPSKAEITQPKKTQQVTPEEQKAQTEKDIQDNLDKSVDEKLDNLAEDVGVDISTIPSEFKSEIDSVKEDLKDIVSQEQELKVIEASPTATQLEVDNARAELDNLAQDTEDIKATLSDLKEEATKPSSKKKAAGPREGYKRFEITLDNGEKVYADFREEDRLTPSHVEFHSIEKGPNSISETGYKSHFDSGYKGKGKTDAELKEDITKLGNMFAEEGSKKNKKTKEKPKTQKEKVADSIKDKKKTIKEISEETDILEPNVRRILGIGAKEGVFSRVEKGVYIVTKNDQDIAYIHNGDAVETLKDLAKEGVKVDMVFLDIPYDTPAVKGGNRGVKYDLLSVEQFKSVLESVKKLSRSEDTPIIHMYSQAESGLKAMEKYNNVFLEKGYKPVGKGQYQKTFADGSPVTSPNGKVSKPEGIIVFTKSGELKKDLGDLNFEFVRPKGYQTEKPAEMLKQLIEMTTEEGDTVLDPFAGSGVTGAEAVKAGRKTIAIEKNKDVAEKITTPRIEGAVPTSTDIKVGDTFQTNGVTNMKGEVTVTDVSGRTVKFTDETGTEFAGLEKSLVKKFLAEGAWSKVESKIKNKEAVPSDKVLYHGTLNTFDKFSIDRAGENTGWSNAKFGIFFLDSEKRAREFIEENKVPGEERPTTIKAVNIDLKNPLDLTLEGIFNNEEQAPLIVKLLSGEEMSGKEALELIDEEIGLGELEDMYDDIYSFIENKKLIQEAGYDGIVSQFGKDENGDVIKEYVVFEDSQIRNIDISNNSDKVNEYGKPDGGLNSDEGGTGEGLPGSSELPITPDTVGSESLDEQVSRYDQATSLVESANESGGNGSTSSGDRIGKKGRQIINEQVEAILEATNYSSNSADYSQEDRELMANYTGAGGKESVGATGRGLLDEYYTPVEVINNIWDIARVVAPNAQTAFEPSAGIGRFITQAPAAVRVDGTELSKVSGTIAQILNPESNISVGDFQELFFDKKTNKIKNFETYDLVIGNPPFGVRAGFLKGKGEESKIGRQEEYFIKRGLDMTKEGGHLIYVVNSSFLETGNSVGKQLINEIGYLEAAYRLPEGTFEDTTIGTDIVVFKKGKKEVETNNLIDGEYFMENPDNVLGTIELRKNRFGKMETYVTGSLEEATKKISELYPAKKEVSARKAVAKDTNVPTKAEAKEEEVKQDSREEVSNEYSILPEKNYKEKVVPSQVLSTGISTPIQSQMLSRIERDGSIPNVTSDEMPFVNYAKGKFYPDSLYFSGPIYEKLDALLSEKRKIIETLGEEQYKKQYDGLNSIIPKPLALSSITFDPMDTQLAEMRVEGTGKSLLNNFVDWIYKTSPLLSPQVGSWDVIRYVQRSRADKDKKKIMGSIKQDAKRLFNTYIREHLNEETQKVIQDNFNKEKNGYVLPDYSVIPYEVANMAKDFRGRPFNASAVQKNGIGFLVTKGSGLVAYGVGVGKTHTLAIATVVNMQKGWTKRPLFTVPKSTITKTWVQTLHQMFPGIKINNLAGLQAPVVRKFEKMYGADRKDWIRDGEITIISHEGLLRLGLNEEEVQETTAELKDALWTEQSTQRGAEKESGKIESIVGQAQKYATDIMFTDLGIDHISVDEVHNFRKVFKGAKAEKDEQGNATKRRYADVIGGTPSKRAQQLFLLTQMVQKRNNNRNVFLASATPFENHATEVYNILSFVARDRMKQMGIRNINDFFSAYANFETELDRTLDGEWINREKMKSYANISSLQDLLKEFIDFQEDPTLIRPERVVMTPHLQMSALQEENLARIQSLLKGQTFQEADSAFPLTADLKVEGEKEEGAFLKASTYSVANSVSPYFIKEYTKTEPTKEELIENSPKIKFAMEYLKMAKANKKTRDFGTFLFFGKFGVEYHPMIKDWIVKYLKYKPEEVAILSGNISDEEKEIVKDRFNDGTAKVLIGGDQTKEGIDLQKNGFATINLALGWNPTQITQVEGRVWRQGNNRNIAPLLYPLVENSGDATIFNKFEEKAGRINDLFSYKGTVFDVSEVDPAEKRLALLTDPVDKAKLQIEIEKKEMYNALLYEESQLESLQKSKSDFENYTSTLVSLEEYMRGLDKETQKTKITETKQQIKSLSEKVKRIEESFERKGISMFELQDKITEMTINKTNMQDNIKKIDDTYDQKLAQFTNEHLEYVRNRKTLDEHIADVEKMINDNLVERSEDEVAKMKAQKVKEYSDRQNKNSDDIAEMAQFVTGEKEVFDRLIAQDQALQERREKAKKARSNFEVKRGRDFLLTQLEKSAHRKLYAGVRLALEGKDLTEDQKNEMERKLSFDIPREQIDAVAHLVNSLPETLFDDLGTRITRTDTPTPGRYNFTNNILEISTKLIAESGGDYSHVVTHELWHHLSQYLPEEDVKLIKKDYEKQRDQYISQNKWFAKYHVDKNNVKDVLLTEKEMEEFNKEFPGHEVEFTPMYDAFGDVIKYKPAYRLENYRFKNLDEWFAEVMSDRSMKYVADTSIATRSVWSYMQQIFRIIKESLVQAFGFDRAGRILSDFIANRNDSLVRVTSFGEQVEADFLAKWKKEKQVLDEVVTMVKQYDSDLTRKDISFLNELTAQPRDLYLKDTSEFKEAAELQSVGEARVRRKNLLDQKLAEILKPYAELNRKERDNVNHLLMVGDREKMEYHEFSLELDGYSKKEIEGYKGVRKAFNSAFDILISEMQALGVPEEDIESYKKERTGYMPHKWPYRFVVKTQKMSAETGTLETKEMSSYKTKAEAEKAQRELRQKWGENDNVRFVVDTLDSLDVDFFSEQRFSFENIKSVLSKSKMDEGLRKQVIESLRDAIKEKGFGRHFIARGGIQGYEKQDVEKIIAEYLTGFTGFVTKMEAGKKYFPILERIDARRQKNFYAWARDLIAFDMGNKKEYNTLKALMFIKYLANDMSFLITNMTQNITMGIPELSKYLTGSDKIFGAEKELTTAMANWTTGIGVTEEEKEVVGALLKAGSLGGEMLAELTGFKNNPIYATLGTVWRKTMYGLASYVERDINRVPAFLAARRILLKQGVEKGAANTQALEIANDIHFRGGKVNRMKVSRGFWGIPTMYTNYLVRYLYVLSRDVKKGEFTSIVKRMFYTALLGGGTAAIPFLRTMLEVVKKIIGGGDDDEDKKEISKLMLILQKGLPAALLNVDMSNNMGIDLLALTNIIDTTNDQNLFEKIGRTLTGPVGGYGESVGKGIQILSQGRILEGLARIIPADFITNPMKAIAGLQGVKTVSGKPLIDLEGNEFKYTPYEAIIKFTGYTPTRESLAWDEVSKTWEAQNIMSRKSAVVKKKIEKAIATGNYAEARSLEESAVKEGKVSGSREIAAPLIKEDMIKKYSTKLDGRSDTFARAAVRDIAIKAYGENYKTHLSSITRELAYRRYFGYENKKAEAIYSASSNKKRVDLLKQYKKEMSTEEFARLVKMGRMQVTYESGKTGYILLSNDVLHDFVK